MGKSVNAKNKKKGIQSINTWVPSEVFKDSARLQSHNSYAEIVSNRHTRTIIRADLCIETRNRVLSKAKKWLYESTGLQKQSFYSIWIF